TTDWHFIPRLVVVTLLAFYDETIVTPSNGARRASEHGSRSRSSSCSAWSCTGPRRTIRSPSVAVSHGASGEGSTGLVDDCEVLHECNGRRQLMPTKIKPTSGPLSHRRRV